MGADPTLRQKYEEYLLSDHWLNLRLLALAAAQRRCEFCGSTKNLQGHHLQYRKLYDCTPDDIMILCGMHHQAWHEKHSSHVIATRLEVKTYLASPERAIQRIKKKPKSPKREKQMRKSQRRIDFKPMVVAFNKFMEGSRTHNDFCGMMNKLNGFALAFYQPVRPKDQPSVPMPPKKPVMVNLRPTPELSRTDLAPDPKKAGYFKDGQYIPPEGLPF